MFKIIFQILFAVGFALGSIAVFAQPGANNNTTQAIAPGATTNIRLCPPASDLIKTAKLTWTTKVGKKGKSDWKSYNMSFVNKIGRFIGAQWTGAALGQITCIYEGAQQHSFPVLLVYGTMALEPEGYNWSKNHGGYRNCKSAKQKNCPFKILLKPQHTNIIKEAETLKPGS